MFCGNIEHFLGVNGSEFAIFVIGIFSGIGINTYDFFNLNLMPCFVLKPVLIFLIFKNSLN